MVAVITYSVFSRRDLLKYFGAGATIVPVLAGVPNIEAPAKLIEEPRIQPVELATMQDIPFARGWAREQIFITVDIASKRGHYRFQADSFLADVRSEPIDVTAYDSPNRQFIPGPMEPVRWTLSGVCLGKHFVTAPPELHQIIRPR